MATPTTPMPIPPEAQDSVVRYLNSALAQYCTTYNVRNQLQLRDQAYYRTNDITQAQARAKAANDQGDPTKTQNVVMPVVMPQVESAVAYVSDVFLSGYPIFGVVAPPDQQEALAQMETLLGENSIRAAWPLNLMQAFRDGFKYNLGAVEVIWESRKIFNIVTPELKNSTAGAAQEAYYEGNFIKRLDPYNLILDSRVEPIKNHLEGEFAGYTEMLSRIEIKKRMESLSPTGTMNFRKALESTCGVAPGATDMTAAYYMPQVNPDALLPFQNIVQFNWLNWYAGTDKQVQGENGIAY